MPDLHFRWGDVEPLVRHAEASSRFSLSMPEQIDLVSERYGVDDVGQIFDLMFTEDVDKWLDTQSGAAGLSLVGDHGVYLMSAGLPRQIDPNGDGVTSVIAYAAGTDPAKDEDWYAAKRALFGGDDRSDKLPLEAFLDYARRYQPDSEHDLLIRLTADSIAFVEPR